MTREIKKPLTLAFLFLAILGWLAAALSFWSSGHESQPTAEVQVGEDQDKVLAQVNSAQQKLTTVQSALSATTRLRDEAAESLQELRARSAEVRKELALASNKLDDIQQTIAIRNSELTTLSKRAQTSRLREVQEKGKADNSSAPSGTPTSPDTVASNTKERRGSTGTTRGEAAKSGTIQIDHGAPSTVVQKDAVDRGQQQSETQVEAMQKKLATAESALAMTTRLRDEAAQALQEIKSRTAGVKKDLATARDQLNAVEQQIAARSSELLSLSKQSETARRQKYPDKQKVDASPRPIATITGEKNTIAATTAKKNTAPSKTTDSALPSTAALPPASSSATTSAVATQSAPNRTEGDASSIAQSSPTTAAVSPGPSPDPAPAPKRKPRKFAETSGSDAVIGPGDFSPPPRSSSVTVVACRKRRKNTRAAAEAWLM